MNDDCIERGSVMDTGYEDRAYDDAEAVADDAAQIDAGVPNDDSDAHRYAEYEGIVSRLDDVIARIDAMEKAMRDGFEQFASVAVDSGAVIRDDAKGVGLADVDEETGELTPIEDLVFFD